MNKETKRYFIDTEFHEHKKRIKFLGITIAKVWTIDLISIGIVCEDGREYYAINRDLNLKHAKKNSWLRDNVLSKLPPKEALYPPHGSPRIWQESMRWLPMSQIKQEVVDFCFDKKGWVDSGSTDRFPNVTPEFCGYYSDYDWVVFCWIFGTMMDLPTGFPMYCKDLKQMLDEKVERKEWYYGRDIWSNTSKETDALQEKDRPATFEEKLEKMKRHDDYPAPYNEHNALADARWNFQLFKFIQSLR